VEILYNNMEILHNNMQIKIECEKGVFKLVFKIKRNVFHVSHLSLIITYYLMINLYIIWNFSRILFHFVFLAYDITQDLY